MSTWANPRIGRLVGKCLATGFLLAAAVHPAAGQTIIDDWSKVQAPVAPKIDPVQVDSKTTALLMLDFVKQICSDRLPRCQASVPRVQKLMNAARAGGALVVYSRTGNSADADIDPMLAPKSGDPVVVSGPDKFIGTDLAKILKDKGITTVIVTGVSANGAVLYTASDAALNGFNVVVPVDGMSAANTYVEQYVAYNMVSAPGMGKVKLATTDGVSFK